MFSLRGDAHKLYLKLKKKAKEDSRLETNKELKEINDIQQFYEMTESSILKKIYYRMLKEKNGSGIVPIFVTAIPWFLFLFSKQLEHLLFHDGSYLWLFFGLVYLSVLTLSVTIHFREKAWASVHLEMIKDIIKKRNHDI